MSHRRKEIDSNVSEARIKIVEMNEHPTEFSFEDRVKAISEEVSTHRCRICRAPLDVKVEEVMGGPDLIFMWCDRCSRLLENEKNESNPGDFE